MVLSRNHSQRSSSQTKKSKSKSSSNPLDFTGPKLGQSIPQDESRAQSSSKDVKLSDSNSINEGTQPSDFSVNSPALGGNFASQQIKRLNFSGFNKKTLTKQRDSQEEIHLTKIPSLKKSKSQKYHNDIIKNQNLQITNLNNTSKSKYDIYNINNYQQFLNVYYVEGAENQQQPSDQNEQILI